MGVYASLIFPIVQLLRHALNLNCQIPGTHSCHFRNKFRSLRGKTSKCAQFKGSIGQFLRSKQTLIASVAVSSLRSEVMGWCSNFLHFIAIGYEVTDKVFDGLTAITYRKLFYHPKDPVYHALLTFMIIGCLVSIVRIYLYIRKMLCIDEGERHRHELHIIRRAHKQNVRELSVRRGESDEDKTCFGRLQLCAFRLNLDRYYQYNVCVHAVKVIIEAFPQSFIAFFALDDCPLKTSEWMIIGFDVFCIAAYVFFICSMCWWYCCYNEGEKGKYMAFITALATVFSIVGCVLACISFGRSVKCP